MIYLLNETMLDGPEISEDEFKSFITKSIGFKLNIINKEKWFAQRDLLFKKYNANSFKECFVNYLIQEKGYKKLEYKLYKLWYS